MWDAREVSMSKIGEPPPCGQLTAGPREGEARTFSPLHPQLFSSLHCTPSYLQRRPQVHPRDIGPVILKMGKYKEMSARVSFLRIRGSEAGPGGLPLK